MPDPLAAARVAIIAERGMDQAVQAVTAKGGVLTDADREWLELGVSYGLLATLEVLAEVGWITGPT